MSRSGTPPPESAADPIDEQPFIRLPRGLAPLGYRNYLFFWIGFAVSNTGRWLELTGALWLAYELSDSPLLLGLIGIARAVPGILLAPIAGVVADRVDQRRLLIVTQLASIVISVALAALVLTAQINLWWVYSAVALQSALWAFDASCRQAFFPRLITRDHLPNAVTLVSTAARAAKFVGPVVAGFAIAGIGEFAPFLINATTFVILIPALIAIRDVPRQIVDTFNSFARDLTEGFRHIFHAPVLWGLFKLEFVFGLFEMNAVMIAIVARERLGVGPEGLGLLLSAPALGSLIGIAWLVAMGHARRPGRLSLLCVFAYAITLILVALSSNYSMTFIALALIGVFDALTTTTRNAVTQLAAPPVMRGRVMASMGVVTRGLSPLAETQSGFFANLIGPTYSILGAAAALALAAGVTIRTNTALWAFSSEEETSADLRPPPNRI